MSEVIELNMDEISKKAKRIQSSLEIVSDRIGSLYSDILYPIGDDWKSKESYSYINKFTNYLEDLKNLHDSIVSYIAFLQTAIDVYEETISECMVFAANIDVTE